MQSLFLSILKSFVLVTIILVVLYFQVEKSSTILINTCSSSKPWYFNAAKRFPCMKVPQWCSTEMIRINAGMAYKLVVYLVDVALQVEYITMQMMMIWDRPSLYPHNNNLENLPGIPHRHITRYESSDRVPSGKGHSCRSCPSVWLRISRRVIESGRAPGCVAPIRDGCRSLVIQGRLGLRNISWSGRNCCGNS